MLWRKTLCFVLAVWLWMLGAELPSGVNPLWAMEDTPPSLIVVIVIDQFRLDYLYRFTTKGGARGSGGGFDYLLKRGVFFRNCRYDHFPTHTAVGHAALLTGALPQAHGIVANTWYDREGKNKVYAVAAPDQYLVGVPGKRRGSSPYNLRVDTVGDELKVATGGKSLVYTVSVKDRAAVLTGGYGADLALWFDVKTGRWVTSTYYAKELPSWVDEFNRSSWVQDKFGYEWRPWGEKALGSVRRKNPRGVAGKYLALGDNFPHILTGGDKKIGEKFYKALTCSPLGNRMTFELVHRMFDEIPLGEDDIPDLVVISLSANDKVGHIFGPYSPEMYDMYARTDRMLAEFLSFLDAKIGLSKVSFVLTADHGVAPLPEWAAGRRFPGRRLKEEDVVRFVETLLTRRFGIGKYVLAFKFPHLYLNRVLLGDKLEQAQRAVAEALENRPGIFRAYAAVDLMAGRVMQDRVSSSVMASFVPDRSGDVIIVPQAFTIFSKEKQYAGTTHGTLWGYDTRVPLIIAWPGIRAGDSWVDCTPRDLATTLSALLGINPPAAASGKILLSPPALRDRPREGMEKNTPHRQKVWFEATQVR